MIRSPSDIIGSVLTCSVLLFCGLSLIFGWGAGIDGLVRITSHANAMVPATSLCLILVAFAQLPLSSIAKVQKLALLAVGLAVVLFALTKSTTAIGLVTYVPGPGDGMSNATLIGLALLCLAPAVRLGLIKLNGEWAFHIPLFGLIFSALAIVAISFDPYYFDTIQPFVNLSHYTAFMMVILFAAQLAIHEAPADDFEAFEV